MRKHFFAAICLLLVPICADADIMIGLELDPISYMVTPYGNTHIPITGMLFVKENDTAYTFSGGGYELFVPEVSPNFRHPFCVWEIGGVYADHYEFFGEHPFTLDYMQGIAYYTSEYWSGAAFGEASGIKYTSVVFDYYYADMSLYFHVSATRPVPEPPISVLLGMGLIGIFAWKFGRHKTTNSLLNSESARSCTRRDSPFGTRSGE